MAVNPRTVEWIAGFLEGEGCFRTSGNSTCTISAAQVESDPIDRLMHYVGGNRGVHVPPQREGFRRSPQHRWSLSGRAAAGLMMTLYALMSPKRKAQISKVLTRWRAAVPYTGFRYQCKRGHPYTSRTVKGRTFRACLLCRRIDARLAYYAHTEGKVKRRKRRVHADGH